MSSFVMPTYARAELQFDHGAGAWLFTSDGEKYLDFGAGIAVNALGHAHPRLVAALKDQGEKLWHTSNLYTVPGQEHLAERLCAVSFAERVFFTNSGAEALECAIKTARRYHFVNGQPDRYRILTFTGAFHGRTLATIAAGGNEKHLEGFGPAVDGFDQCRIADRAGIEAAIGPETAGILVEPVQGEGGIIVVPHDALVYLRRLCDAHGLLLIFDEVQCGMGRTGSLFAYEQAGVAPDIMALAKGIGGGFPLGACLATAQAARGMTAGAHGSTYGGNPLAMAIGNAVMDEMTAPGFLDHIAEMGGYFGQKLGALIAAHPRIFDSVRGVGLMRGLQCRMANSEVVQAAMEQHLLSVAAGDNVVRLLPPLNITQAEIDAAIDALDRAATALEAGGEAP